MKLLIAEDNPVIRMLHCELMNDIEATKIIRRMTNYFPIMALTISDDYKKVCY